MFCHQLRGVALQHDRPRQLRTAKHLPTFLDSECAERGARIPLSVLLNCFLLRRNVDLPLIRHIHSACSDQREFDATLKCQLDKELAMGSNTYGMIVTPSAAQTFHISSRMLAPFCTPILNFGSFVGQLTTSMISMAGSEGFHRLITGTFPCKHLVAFDVCTTWLQSVVSPMKEWDAGNHM